jgi:hypothetical protein
VKKICDDDADFREVAKSMHKNVSIKEIDIKYLKTKT